MYDIDLMWHTHQVYPKAYQKDMKSILGYVMTHDDTDQSREAGSRLVVVSTSCHIPLPRKILD